MGKNMSKAGNRLTSRRGRRGSVNPEGVPQMTAETAVLTLKNQRDEVRRYKTELESRSELETYLIKQLIQTNRKDAAKLLLRKKRFQQYLLEESERQLESVLRQCEANDITLGQKIDEAQAAQGVERGDEALKMIRKFMELENVEKILEESEESAKAEAEIDRVLLLTSGGADKNLMDEMMAVDKELEELVALTGVEGDVEVKAEPANEEEEVVLIVPEKVEVPQDPDARIPEAIIAEMVSGGVAVLEQTEGVKIQAKTVEVGQETSATGTEASSISSEPSKEDAASADISSITANFNAGAESELEIVARKSQIVANNAVWKELGLVGGKDSEVIKETEAPAAASGVTLRNTDDVSRLLLPNVPSNPLAD